jgi:hypothetical protein
MAHGVRMRWSGFVVLAAAVSAALVGAAQPWVEVPPSTGMTAPVR